MKIRMKMKLTKTEVETHELQRSVCLCVHTYELIFLIFCRGGWLLKILLILVKLRKTYLSILLLTINATK